MEIACDESGYEADKLIGSTTDVFAHGSVRLELTAAAEIMGELRARIRSPALEYKAGHVLREKHRSVLVWLFEPAGPLTGAARAFLIDKAFFVVATLVDRLLPDAGAVAGALYREGRRRFDREPWEAFLAAANDLLRARDSDGAFLRAVGALRDGGPPGPVGEILNALGRAGPRVEALRARLSGDLSAVPALDPLIPAIVRAARHWGGGEGVSIVHDQQNTLSPRRIAVLRDLVPLAGFRLVDSRSDARVQVADVLAGAARKIASDELNGRGDASRTALLRPFVDPHSIWGDEQSWAELGP